VPINPRRILYIDEHLLVINKMPRELSVAVEEKSEETEKGALSLFDFLKTEYPGLRVVHRLDYGTSGAIMFARSAEVVRVIRDSKFKDWEKHYWGLVGGVLKYQKGTIDTPLKARMSTDTVPAVSHYHVKESFGIASLVEVKIDTGRKHQVRQHLKAIGSPLLFDPLYNDKKADGKFRKFIPSRYFYLHAEYLAFNHPITGVRMALHAPLPHSFTEILDVLRHKKEVKKR
jgi:23S rRNA pseudouridine1911/1915/1917 synthase